MKIFTLIIIKMIAYHIYIHAIVCKYSQYLIHQVQTNTYTYKPYFFHFILPMNPKLLIVNIMHF